MAVKCGKYASEVRGIVVTRMPDTNRCPSSRLSRNMRQSGERSILHLLGFPVDAL
jgi:hypothetical protein